MSVYELKKSFLSLLSFIFIISTISCTLLTNNSGSLSIDLDSCRSVADNKQTFIIILEDENKDIFYSEETTKNKVNINYIPCGKYTLKIKTKDGMYKGVDQEVIIKDGEETPVIFTLIAQLKATINSVENGLQLSFENLPKDISQIEVVKTYTRKPNPSKPETRTYKEIITKNISTSQKIFTILDPFVIESTAFEYTAIGKDKDGKTIKTFTPLSASYNYKNGKTKGLFTIGEHSFFPDHYSPNTKFELRNGNCIESDSTLKVAHNLIYKSAANNELLTISLPPTTDTRQTVDLTKLSNIEKHYFERLPLYEYNYELNYLETNFKRVYNNDNFFEIINDNMKNVQISTSATVEAVSQGMKVTLPYVNLPNDTTFINIYKDCYGTTTSSSYKHESIRLDSKNFTPGKPFTFIDTFVNKNEYYFYSISIGSKTNGISTDSVPNNKAVLATGGSGDIYYTPTTEDITYFDATYNTNKVTLKNSISEKIPLVQLNSPDISFDYSLAYVSGDHTLYEASFDIPTKCFTFTSPNKEVQVSLDSLDIIATYKGDEYKYSIDYANNRTGTIPKIFPEHITLQ